MPSSPAQQAPIDLVVGARHLARTTWRPCGLQRSSALAGMLTGRELSQVDQTQLVVACFDYDRGSSRMAVEVAELAARGQVSGDHWRKREGQEGRVGPQEEEAPSLQVHQAEAAVPRAA